MVVGGGGATARGTSLLHCMLGWNWKASVFRNFLSLANVILEKLLSARLIRLPGITIQSTSATCINYLTALSLENLQTPKHNPNAKVVFG